MRSLVLAVLSALAVGPCAWSQALWTRVAPPSSPPARAGSTGASTGSALLLFGGNAGGNLMLQDVWSFDGATWTDHTPTAGSAPAARDWHACCWDAWNQRLIVFGGRDGANQDLGDTWTFDGSTWTPHTSPVAPSPRRWASMQFDPRGGYALLFGGYENAMGQFRNDTWSWDGATWRQLSPALAPSPRARGHLAWYPPTEELMYCGGRTALSGGVVGETWLFDRVTWRQLSTPTIPGPTNAGLFAGAMSYDEHRERMILFGGTQSGPVLGTTWEFDGVDWRDRGNPGNVPARTFPSLAYLASTRATYAFGGFSTAALGDTWKYASATPASVELSGAGCAGSTGVLRLGHVGQPWTGSAFTLTMSNVGLAPATFFLGRSDTTWNGLSLPLSLAPWSAPGCTLYTEVHLPFAVAWSGSIAQLTLLVPPDPTLRSARLYSQGLTLDPAANGLGLAFSDLATLIIGSR